MPSPMVLPVAVAEGSYWVYPTAGGALNLGDAYPGHPVAIVGFSILDAAEVGALTITTRGGGRLASAHGVRPCSSLRIPIPIEGATVELTSAATLIIEYREEHP